ncbi:hypothetical protein [Azospirillum rugosum]|uniref:Uncharacterized protein n=1 Tax=Azospirillum rugosum TaxID=416170 RepID=A0ABS4SFA7_9PROT|nr:hypothetical protein [Azospirillum rugosum]MBP2290753.1 hypothetical protein [Azospirillum rugosum]MDQ0525642.1 hypothetical protein [Azospirillum rugosum]
MCGVLVWGLPTLRSTADVIRLQVEEPPAVRPRPTLVYSAACADVPEGGS